MNRMIYISDKRRESTNLILQANFKQCTNNQIEIVWFFKKKLNYHYIKRITSLRGKWKILRITNLKCSHGEAKNYILPILLFLARLHVNFRPETKYRARYPQICIFAKLCVFLILKFC